MALRLGQEELDDRHHDLGSTNRRGKGKSADRLATNARVLGADRRVDDAEADLGGVVEQLRVLDLPGEIGQVEMLERPGEYVDVQPVAPLGVADVGRRCERAGRRPIDRSGVQVHPVADALQGSLGPYIEVAAGGGSPR
jgi:hypothetical protein